MALMIELMDASTDFPRLADALGGIRLPGFEALALRAGLDVFDARPPGWRNKRRLFPLHRGGTLSAWAWWAASAPWRRAVYRAG